MAEQAKFKGVLDRINSLPDHIICHILSFLPTKYAVRTSVLSSRWRYLFPSSISILDFNDCLRSLPAKSFKNSVSNLLNFVDRLLSNPKLVSLECFTVNNDWVTHDGHVENDHLRINGWLSAALRLNVKKIGVYFVEEDDYFHTLPALLFTSQSLVTLELELFGGDIEVPTYVSLPNLKTLRFNYFIFRFVDGSSVLRLISSCPVLEDLAFIECDFLKISELNIYNLSLKRLVLDLENMYYPRDFNVIVINAPYLVYFNYVGTIDVDYKSLEKANITVRQSDVLHLDEEEVEEAYDVTRQRSANLLQAISNVNSLYLAIKQAETLIPMHREPLLQFHKLVELEIYNVGEDWQGTWVIEFLHCVPNLKTLRLNLAVARTRIKPLPKEVPSCMLFHLKEIEILNFIGDEPMFEMISFFLDHATFLEKLIIPINFIRYEERLSIAQKLLDLPRNSKKCRVVI